MFSKEYQLKKQRNYDSCGNIVSNIDVCGCLITGFKLTSLVFGATYGCKHVFDAKIDCKYLLHLTKNYLNCTKIHYCC
jgi:hypothetical protein